MRWATSLAPSLALTHALPVAVSAGSPMPSLVFPELFLCADGGGTSVTVAIASASGGILARGSAGPCNV